MNEPVELDEQTLDEFISPLRGPALVDFSAPWCAPCLAMAPVLRELSLRLKDQVRIGRVNVDAFPAIAARFQVLGVPTLMFFCRGETFAHVIGFQAAPALKRWLTQTLNACIECEDK